MSLRRCAALSYSLNSLLGARALCFTQVIVCHTRQDRIRMMQPAVKEMKIAPGSNEYSKEVSKSFNGAI